MCAGKKKKKGKRECFFQFRSPSFFHTGGGLLGRTKVFDITKKRGVAFPSSLSHREGGEARQKAKKRATAGRGRKCVVSAAIVFSRAPRGRGLLKVS